MASDWLNHKALYIIKGIGKTPTDSLSAEINPVNFNLMTDGVVALQEWIPQIAAVKSGGIWTESAITDGRQLLAAPVGNVIEKIEILISDKSYNVVNQQLSSLNKMAADCRDFWQTQGQIDPVYLYWKAGCTPSLPQYALLYNIELSPNYQASDKSTIAVSITLEREPYWRPIPPGANPKLWTFYVNNQQIGGNKTLADASLATGSDHLLTQTIQNKFEWTPTAYGLQTTPLTQNYVDIPATLIPGDAPALLELAITVATEVPARIYVGKSSKDLSQTNHLNVAKNETYTLNAGDSITTNGIAAGTSTTGVRSDGSSVNFNYGASTSTGIDTAGTWPRSWRWGEENGSGLIQLDRHLFRGSYAIFARARNNSVTPVLTDMKMRVRVQEWEEDLGGTALVQQVILPEAHVPIATANPYEMTYMGTVTIPLSKRTAVSVAGYGVQVQETLSNLHIILDQRVDVATANRIFEVVDLVLIPLDEGMFQVSIPFTSVYGQGLTIIDNTGYLSHGDNQVTALSYENSLITAGVSQEFTGQDIILTPGMAQRLYFLFQSYPSGSVTPRSLLTQTATIRLNIVPRWSGIRDT